MRSWGALVLSGAAIAISAFTAYYNFIRQSFDVSLFVEGDFASGAFAESGGLESFYADGDFVFTNNGNRPIAILHAELELIQLRNIDPGSGRCIFGHSDVVDRANVPATRDFDAFVVRPGEIEIRKIEFALQPNRPVRLVADDSDPNLILSPVVENEPADFVSCLEIGFITSGGLVETVKHRFSVSVGGGTSSGPNNRRPVVLVQK